MHTDKNLQVVRFSSITLLVHGLLLIPAFLLQKILIIRVIQTVVLLFLSMIAIKPFLQKRRHLVFSFFSFIFIVFFNIFAPHGEVLFKIFSFSVTSGAISIGLFKATAFTGLLTLSRITVTKAVPFSGFLGKMIGQVFYYLDQLQKTQGKYKTKNIMKRIDLTMMDITASAENNMASPETEKHQTSIPGFILIIFSLTLHWGLLVISLFVT